MRLLIAVVKDGTAEIYHGPEPKSISWLSKLFSDFEKVKSGPLETEEVFKNLLI